MGWRTWLPPTLHVNFTFLRESLLINRKSRKHKFIQSDFYSKHYFCCHSYLYLLWWPFLQPSVKQSNISDLFGDLVCFMQSIGAWTTLGWKCIKEKHSWIFLFHKNEGIVDNLVLHWQSSCCGGSLPGSETYAEAGKTINSWYDLEVTGQDSIDFLNTGKQQQQGQFTHERFRSANLDVPSVGWKSSWRSQIENIKCEERENTEWPDVDIWWKI